VKVRRLIWNDVTESARLEWFSRSAASRRRERRRAARHEGIVRYYTRHSEKRPLELRGQEALESLARKELVLRYLPLRCNVLDIGGGVAPTAAGWANWATASIARHRGVAGSRGTPPSQSTLRVTGDARAPLPHGDRRRSRPAIGPLYHSRSGGRASRRARSRGLRPADCLFASAMLALPPRCSIPGGGWIDEPGAAGMVQRDLRGRTTPQRDGQRPALHPPPTFHRPGELATEVRDSGCQLISLSRWKPRLDLRGSSTGAARISASSTSSSICCGRVEEAPELIA